MLLPGPRGGSVQNALNLTYIEFNPADNGGGLADAGIGICSSLASDGFQIGDGTDAIRWVGSSGVIESNGSIIKIVGSWNSSNVPGIGFGPIPDGNSVLLNLLGITGSAGDHYAFFFKDGVYQHAIRLATYLTSPVRPGAYVRRDTGAAPTFTLQATVASWTNAPATTINSQFSGNVLWADENSVVLSGGDLTAGEGTVPIFTPFRTTIDGSYSF